LFEPPRGDGEMGGDSPEAAAEEALPGDSVGCVEPLVHAEHVGVKRSVGAGCRREPAVDDPVG